MVNQLEEAFRIHAEKAGYIVYRNGFPDFLIVSKDDPTKGLWIEIKDKNDEVRENQKLVLDALTNLGYPVFILKKSLTEIENWFACISKENDMKNCACSSIGEWGEMKKKQDALHDCFEVRVLEAVIRYREGAMDQGYHPVSFTISNIINVMADYFGSTYSRPTAYEQVTRMINRLGFRRRGLRGNEKTWMLDTNRIQKLKKFYNL